MMMADREIVAVSRWQFPHTLSAAQRAEKEQWDASAPARPEGYNMDLDKEFSGALNRCQEKWVDDSKDYSAPFPLFLLAYTFFLANQPISKTDPISLALTSITTVLLGLAVSPTHQRRGLGSMLLCEGLARADAAGARTYLESSAKGVGLYLSYGFRLVEDIEIDMRRYGGSGVAVEKCMMREAGGE